MTDERVEKVVRDALEAAKDWGIADPESVAYFGAALAALSFLERTLKEQEERNTKLQSALAELAPAGLGEAVRAGMLEIGLELSRRQARISLLENVVEAARDLDNYATEHVEDDRFWAALCTALSQLDRACTQSPQGEHGSTSSVRR